MERKLLNSIQEKLNSVYTELFGDAKYTSLRIHELLKSQGINDLELLVKIINAKQNFGVHVKIPNITKLGYNNDIKLYDWNVFSARFNKIVEANIMIKGFYFVVHDEKAKPKQVIDECLYDRENPEL